MVVLVRLQRQGRRHPVLVLLICCLLAAIFLVEDVKWQMRSATVSIWNQYHEKVSSTGAQILTKIILFALEPSQLHSISVCFAKLLTGTQEPGGGGGAVRETCPHNLEAMEAPPPPPTLDCQCRSVFLFLFVFARELGSLPKK